MKSKILACAFFTFHFSLFIYNSAFAQTKDYASLVNPFIGTGGHGHTYPGAAMPFGGVQLSPDTRLDGWDGCGGYHYSDSIIYGFSHTHLSGTGCSDYGDILLMPIITEDKFKIFDNKLYSSKFSHKNESASTGYYKVKLDKFNIMAEMTVTPRTGFHRYTFRKTKEATIIIDLKHRDEVIDSYMTIVNDSAIKGLRRSKAWATDQWVYFYIQFSKPFLKYGVAENDMLIRTKEAHGKNVKGFVTFDATDGKPVLVKVGISAVNEDGARKNLAAENPAWNFDAVKNAASKAWNNELSKIEIEGGSKDKQIVFYTALYHTMLNPNLYMDVDGNFRSTDNKVHNLEQEVRNGQQPIGVLDEAMSGNPQPISHFTNYTVFSLWDTYRALHPLLSIIDQIRTTDFINTFVAEYHYGKILPVWELSGNETWCMIGYHSVPVIADAFMKGIRGFDANLALTAMKHSADTTLFGLECYRKFGFLSNDCEHESVSKTLEYAYDDWCIATMANQLGKKDDYKRFIMRAQSYKNVFDPNTGFMRGKDNGLFHSPFDASEVNNYFTEANSWQYSFYVPQDLNGLMNLHGGRKNFADKLDALFTTSSKLSGREQSDITGMIGQYAHGNEPSHHITYLYDYCGQPWKTQKLVHYICDSLYSNAPDGLCGNEDCGQMSAWFVMSAMGLYEVCPGSNQYAIGAPQFDKITIHLENKKSFVITATNRSDKNFYIKSSTLNNESYNKFYLNHSDLMKGGVLDFTMDEMSESKMDLSGDEIPKTAINDHAIVSAPYINANSNVFRGSQQIAFASVDTSEKIFYRVNNGLSYSLYEKPFAINQKSTIDFYAQGNSGIETAIISSQFLKIPDNRTITLKTKYDPQYTAGGDDALIDGQRGEANWRKGGWQGYWGKDVDATIDLGKSQPIKKIGLGCLQDAGPWIMFPSVIEFYTSDDNINFKKIGETKPTPSTPDMKLETQTFFTDVQTSARYIKVVAKNLGKLPAWHISAGELPWLFVDEIVVE